MVNPQSANQVAADLTLETFSSIESKADLWDQIVPRDVPALRSGFLRAVERGEMIRAPQYFLAVRNEQPIAAAFAYTVLLDTAMSAESMKRKCIQLVRKVYPGFLWRPMRVCGPPISNGECGFYFRSGIEGTERQAVVHEVAAAVEQSAGKKQLIFFKEFRDEDIRRFASVLDERGYFDVDPGPGTELAIRWNTFDDYLAALKKRYRRRIRQDAKAGEDLEFELLDSFAELAETVTTLYDQVLARATYNVERATRSFFSAVADFDQARLLVARQKADGQITGANLLLFGDTCMHNLYIGFDYESNRRFNTYFNLVEESLRIAFEQNLEVCYFGPASYEFKTRLGATTFPLTAYMKHPVGFVHRMLESNKDKLWPEDEIPSHDVFRDSPSASD